MKYKVEKGTPLFDSLMAVFEKIKISRSLIDGIIKEVGADDYSGRDSLSGNIDAFHFSKNEQPHDNWKPMDGKNGFWWMPKSNTAKKLNQEIWDKIASVPKVEYKELNNIVATGFQAYGSAGGLTVFNCPRCQFYQDYILLTFPDEIDYKPVDGMMELLGSEFKELSTATPLTFD